MKAVIGTLVLASTILLIRGEDVSEDELENMFDQDTDTCKELAQNMFPEDLFQQLDEFLLCLANQLAKIPDVNDEIIDVKDTLKQIENNDLFTRKKKELFKRDTANIDHVDDTIDNSQEVVDHDSKEMEIGVSEGRKWKKRNKRKRKKQPLPADIREDEEREKEKPTAAFTNGIQFSAYSGHQPQAQKPAYQRPVTSAPSRQDQNMLMYGMDGQGNPQYIDEDVVSLLLQNPQAKKAIMRYLVEEQQPKQPSFNAQTVLSQTQAEQLNLQTDAALSDDQYSLPPYAPQRPPYSQPGPPYQPTGNQVLAQPDPRPVPPPLPREPPPAKLAPVRGSGSPLLDYFGPSDFVPKVAHLVPGGHIKLPSRRQDNWPLQLLSGLPNKKIKPEYLILEPKPRRKRSGGDFNRRSPKILQLFSNFFSAARTAKADEKKNEDVSDVQCQVCKEDPNFNEKNEELCIRCLQKDPECKKCRYLDFFLEHKDKCRKCMQILTTRSADGDFRIEVKEVSIVDQCTDDRFMKGHPKVCSPKRIKKCKRLRFNKKNPEKCQHTIETIITDEEDINVDDESDIVDVRDDDDQQDSEEIRKDKRAEEKEKRMRRKCEESRHFVEKHQEFCKNLLAKKESDSVTIEQVAICAEDKYQNIKKCQSILAKVQKDCSGTIYRVLNFVMCTKYGGGKQKDKDVDNENSEDEESSDLTIQKVRRCRRKKRRNTEMCKKITEELKVKCLEMEFKTENPLMCEKKLKETEDDDMEDVVEKDSTEKDGTEKDENEDYDMKNLTMKKVRKCCKKNMKNTVMCKKIAEELDVKCRDIKSLLCAISCVDEANGDDNMEDIEEKDKNEDTEKEESKEEEKDDMENDDEDKESSNLTLKKVRKCRKKNMKNTVTCKKITEELQVKCSDMEFKEENPLMCEKFVKKTDVEANEDDNMEDIDEKDKNEDTEKEESKEEEKDDMENDDEDKESSNLTLKKVRKCRKKNMKNTAVCKRITEELKTKCSEIGFQENNPLTCEKFVEKTDDKENDKEKDSTENKNEEDGTKDEIDDDSKNDKFEDKMKDLDWLNKKCRQNKFRVKHKVVCKELCANKDFAEKLKVFCNETTTKKDTTSVESEPLVALSLDSDTIKSSTTPSITEKETIDVTEKPKDTETIITDVILDIIGIVMQENKNKDDSKQDETTEDNSNTAEKATTTSTTPTTSQSTTTESTTTTKPKTTTSRVTTGTTTTKVTTTTTTTSTQTPTSAASASSEGSSSIDPPASTTPSS